uniref:Uncharacterized protein n=1 Tax=Xenopus tropicalis TaxID=8364 RepID=A0A803K856_XENTR
WQLNGILQGFVLKLECNQKARQKQIQDDRELAERLQCEEEEAYASGQGAQAGPQSLTFSKFEEKKSNEKTRKVTTKDIKDAKSPSPSLSRPMLGN